MALEAVVFDMDGVLTDTVDYHYRSWKKVAEEWGLPFTYKDNEKLLGLTRGKSLEMILGERSLPEADRQEILARKNRYFLESIQAMGPEDLLPGVLRFLREIQSAGLRIAVASASRNTRIVLERLGILRYMDAVSDGNVVARSKPHPDVFLHAAARLHARPESCIAVEDSAPGIEAARLAGMFVIGLGPLERVGNAHAVYRNLAEVSLEAASRLFSTWTRQEAISARRSSDLSCLPGS